MNLTEISEQVLAYLSSERIALSDDLTEVEAVVAEQVRRIGARAIELHLAGRKLGYEGCVRSCRCGGVQRFIGHRPKRVATLLGMISIRRAYYRCPSCRATAFPYDTAVGLGNGPTSEGLAKAAALLGVQDPFDPAGQMLYELTGQRLSERTVARLTEQVGAQAAALETILQRLRDEKSRARAAPKRTALQSLITYIENQDDRLAYDRFRALGLDIGSGRVEAACKHVVGARMKRCGMRWSAAGSQNTLSLRVVRLNGDWDAFWKRHPLARAG